MFYTRGEAIEFIISCFGDGVPSNHGLNFSVECPFCNEQDSNTKSKKKLVIKTDDFLTHCWVCGYSSSNIYELIKKFKPFKLDEYKTRFLKQKEIFQKCEEYEKFNNLHKGIEKPNKETITLENDEKVVLPSDFMLLATHIGKNIRSVENAWRYLQERLVTVEDLWYWKFGVSDLKEAFVNKDGKKTSYRFRVIVPSFDSSGTLNYFSARAYWSKLNGPKYTNPPVKKENIIFNEINIDWKEELTLVEGVFDLIKSNYNATCVLGSRLNSTDKLFQKIVENSTPILLAFDRDAIKKTMRTAKLLSEYGIKVRIFNHPDNINDVGELKKNEFTTLAKAAKVFEKSRIFEEIIKNA